MSEIYEALRDAERQKSTARAANPLPAPIDTPPAAASAPAPAADRKSSLIRGVRGRLERLAAKASQAGPGADVEESSAPTAERGADTSNLQSVEDAALELLRELAALEARFLALADRLTAAVNDLRSGRPAPGSLAGETMACQSAFDALRKRVAELTPSAVFAETAASTSASLNDLLTVLQSTMEAERQRRQFEETRGRAAAELDRVLHLVHSDGAAFPPLDSCQSQARNLKAQLTQAEWPNFPEECRLVAERQHTFSRLLDLVERGGKLTDEEWEAAEEAVSSSLGKPLAIAVARGRLRLETDAAS